jgi:predicted transposase/invertase (TIGR01784 family)
MPKKRLISFAWAMKKLLRSKANFEILEGFLSELLKENIRILEILESESNKDDQRDNFNKVDLKVKNQHDEIIIIEVQYEREFDYLERILYGTSKVITEHLHENDPYSEVVKVISVNILYFDLGQGEDYVYHGVTTFTGLHNQDVLQLSDDQQELYKKAKIHQIFPEYYLVKVNNFNDIAKDTLDEWIYFLKNEEIKEDFKAKGLVKAKHELDILKLPEQERRAYERYQDDLHLQASMVESSYTIGVKKGVKRGLEQGLEQGLEKGEKRKAIEIAKNLIDVLDSKTIASKTGLTEREVDALRE